MKLLGISSKSRCENRMQESQTTIALAVPSTTKKQKIAKQNNKNKEQNKRCQMPILDLLVEEYNNR